MIHKFLHIIIATTLFFSTAGVTVTAYFCGDNLSGLSILPPSECQSTVKACCIKSEGKKKCCTSDSEFVKIDIDQLTYPSAEFTDIDFIDIEITPSHSVIDLYKDQKIKAAFLYRPPPLLINQIIEFQNFRC